MLPRRWMFQALATSTSPITPSRSIWTAPAMNGLRAALRAVLHHDLVAAGGLEQQSAFAEVVAARLLHVDVLARLAGQNGRRGVPVIGRGDDHGVDRLVVEHAPQVGHRVLGTDLFLRPAAARLVRVADVGDVGDPANSSASPAPRPPQPMTPTVKRSLAPAALIPPVQAQAAAPAEAAAVCFRNDLRLGSLMAGLQGLTSGQMCNGSRVRGMGIPLTDLIFCPHHSADFRSNARMIALLSASPKPAASAASSSRR